MFVLFNIINLTWEISIISVLKHIYRRKNNIKQIIHPEKSNNAPIQPDKHSIFATDK